MAKHLIIALVMCFLAFLLGACSSDDALENTPLQETEKPEEDIDGETVGIKMTVGSTVITATLNDSGTTKAFVASLPRTMTMNRYDDREYYGRIGTPLPEDGERIETFVNGDVTYFTTGGSFAIFFDKDNESRQSGLIRMGRITSDLNVFHDFEDDIEVRIEVNE